MRLLLVQTGSDLYGASRSFARLSSRLVADGHTVLALLPYDGPLVNELRNKGVDTRIETAITILTREKFGSKLKLLQLLVSFPRAVLRMCAIIRAFRPDIVHTNTATAVAPGVAARLCRVPHLWHVREFFEDFRSLWPWYERFMVQFSDRIACVSGPVASQFNSRHQAKTVILHNGFPREEFEPVPPERTLQFRNRFGLIGCKAVGLVGRIKFGRKGQEVFVRAAAKIKDKFPDARFICIGSPFPGNEDHLVRLQQLVSDLDLNRQFVYTGDIDDIKAAYSALDVSVLGSAQPEPFGGVVVESMAMGIPVVGTAAGGTIEQIDDGVTGFLVPPGDPDAMARAVEQLLSSTKLRDRLGKAGRARFLKEFEFEPFYVKIIALYQTLAQSKKRTAHA
jgi:glycosyltransferase involved in cell wall biosynthesis